MEFRLLGPLTVVDDHAAEISLKGERVRRLLALLVLHAGRVVPVDRIVDELWGDDQPADAPNALHTQVSRLRSALRAAGRSECIATRPPGYVLEVEPDEVDFQCFERESEEGRARFAEGDAAGAAAILHAALARWRGDALADIADDDFARAERARLAELRRTVEEDRVDAELAAGRHAELVGELEALVAAEPLRERRTAQLMLALYRAGRQADALRVFQAAREVLIDELGIEPSTELRELETAILEQDAALAAPPRLDATVVMSAPARLEIPRPLSECVGRHDEIAELERRVATHRLVTLVGPGGAGKTRLAVEVGRRTAERFRDGAVLVDLAPVDRPGAIVPAMTRALGFDEPRTTSGGAETVQDAAVVLAQVVRERELLVVVDNCEHLLDDVATVVTTVLGRCAGVSVLATSREALGLPGEQTFLVPPLDTDDAVALFTARALAGSPHFTVDDAAHQTISELCARLDGMPLAIELAASRTRVFSVAQLAERLADRFRLVAGTARGSLPRHQTLRAVVDWSYDLIDDDERRVFERLSVFAGGCTLAAAEAVVAGDDVDVAAVPDLLERLVAKSLVATRDDPNGIRFTMLQTLIEYGREKLIERGDDGATRRRHAEWLRDEALRADECGPMTISIELSPEIDNVRAATVWALEHDPALALDLAARLGWFWTLNDVMAEGWRVLVRGLELADDVVEDVRIRALAWACGLANMIGERVDAETRGAEAVERARRFGDPRLIGIAACQYAAALTDRGSFDEAMALLSEGRAHLETVDDQFALAHTDMRESYAVFLLEGPEAAYRLVRRATERFRSIGDRGAQMYALDALGEAAEAAGHLDEAAAALEQSWVQAASLPGIGRRSLTLSRLARVRLAQDRLDEALALAEEAEALARNQTWALVTGFATNALGMVLDRLGRHDDAVRALEEAVTSFASIGMAPLAAVMQYRLDETRNAMVAAGERRPPPS
ncbi:MAG TPA: BTAD domain-containing putative transcriptional regulator [Acidimicrobiia bacterium]|nr:BTAD domain-containing putative transcriptional regulator [Acidimicrobiia bacterium]